MEQWQQKMRERREKGQTIREYCREAGIQESAYFYWQRRLREAVAAKAEVGMQVSTMPDMEAKGWLVVQPEGKANASTGLSVEVNGCWIRVYQDTDEGLLQKVCRALKAV